MMYQYVKYADGTEVNFSDIYIENDIECIDVHFERPVDNGFDSVRIQLPTYKVTIWEGNYSEEEIEFFKRVTESSADLFYQYAREGGLKLA